MEITRIDSVKDYFVFQTRNESGNKLIILAEKDKVNNCQPFKKFIIADSIHRTSVLKSGSGKDLIGFNLAPLMVLKLEMMGSW